MNNHYIFVHILHLLCAISFIGVVFFEIVILEGMRKPLGAEKMAEVELALINRARRIMPWIVGTLFLTGFVMFYTYWPVLKAADSHFAKFLWIKFGLAMSVLAHFIYALSQAADGCMNSSLFKKLHYSVATHMILIIIFAKVMFIAT